MEPSRHRLAKWGRTAIGRVLPSATASSRPWAKPSLPLMRVSSTLSLPIHAALGPTSALGFSVACGSGKARDTTTSA